METVEGLDYNKKSNVTKKKEVLKLVDGKRLFK